MTRQLDLTQRQVRAICEGAKKAGYAPIVQVGNMLVRLVPEDRAILPQDNQPVDAGTNPANFQTFEEWDAWEKRKNDREAQGHS